MRALAPLHILLSINFNMQKSIINNFRFDGDNILSAFCFRMIFFLSVGDFLLSRVWNVIYFWHYGGWWQRQRRRRPTSTVYFYSCSNSFNTFANWTVQIYVLCRILCRSPIANIRRRSSYFTIFFRIYHHNLVRKINETKISFKKLKNANAGRSDYYLWFIKQKNNRYIHDEANYVGIFFWGNFRIRRYELTLIAIYLFRFGSNFRNWRFTAIKSIR